MKILAIDLGKFNRVACIDDGKITKNRFQKFNTAPGVVWIQRELDKTTLQLIPIVFRNCAKQ